MRRLIPALFAAGLLLLLASAPAAGSHHQFRFGVIDDTINPPTDIPAMSRARVKSLRFNFSWVRIEQGRPVLPLCNTATYDWRRTDQVVAQASRRGIRVLPVIVGSPRYVAPASTQAPDTRVRAEIESYKCFLRALVRRYARGGTFVGPGRPGTPVTQWQVWNEPNLRSFSPRGRVEPREYARLVRITSTIIRGRDRQASIVLAGMPELTNTGASIHNFLRSFYGLSGIRRHFDAVALHPYARSVKGVSGALTRLRDTLRRLRDARRVVWVTETGWATRGTGGLTFLRKTEKGQATQLRKTFRMLRANQRRFKVGTVHWFRWRDKKSYAQRGGVFEFAGLFKLNGRPKPSCRAFVSFTGGSCGRIARTGASTATFSSSAARTGAAAGIEPSPPE